MNSTWANLTESERAAHRAATAFLDSRLAERETLNWALELAPSQRVERAAIEGLLESKGHSLPSPWAAAWRLVEESWAYDSKSLGRKITEFELGQRIRAGERSGSLIIEIVNLVAPRLKVEPLSALHLSFAAKRKKPNTVEHLLSARITSGPLADLQRLAIDELYEVRFLTGLAKSLEAAVNSAIEIGARTGWGERRSFLYLGMLSRVYYTGGVRGEDPDSYHKGVAPSVKLLHAVVDRLSQIDSAAALPLIKAWKVLESSVFIRLWAALARNNKLIGSQEIAAFLQELGDREFWELDVFPEVAELRAARFGDLDGGVQAAIAERVIAGPPRKLWPPKMDPNKVRTARLYWAVRELRRIEFESSNLPQKLSGWLKENIEKFPDLLDMDAEEGLPTGVTVRAVPAKPDNRYDALTGVDRLRALEAALTMNRVAWDDDPAQRAIDWIREANNVNLILPELEDAGRAGSDFPRVWDRFGWAHSQKPSVSEAAAQSTADRVLVLLDHLSSNSLTLAVHGISNWLEVWKRQVVTSANGLSVWLKMWPIAVRAAEESSEKEPGTNLVAVDEIDDEEARDSVDTLNSPTGKLVDVFLAACPAIGDQSKPFSKPGPLSKMREMIIETDGRSGLIAKHKLIEMLPYFMRADEGWAQSRLIGPLMAEDSSALSLWRAIARRTHFANVLNEPPRVCRRLGL